MPDDAPLARQWALLRMLSTRRHGLTVLEMVAETRVNAKTIRRDLDTFRGLGFPLIEEVGDHGRKRWRITHPNGQPPPAFTYDEALALYLGRRFLEPLAGTAFWEASQRAFRKVRAMLGEHVLEYLDRCGATIHPTAFGAGDYARKADLIDHLMVAIEDRQGARLTYQSDQATEPATRAVEPYALAYHRGSLYLVAFAPEHQQVRHYKVDRIESVELAARLVTFKGAKDLNSF